MVAKKRIFILWVNCAAMASVIIFLAGFLFHSSYSFATQANTNAAGQAPVFRSNARVVLIDVIVTDKDGNPVRGLEPQDFALTDDGKQQRLSAAEEHQQEMQNSVPSPFVPGRNTQTNRIDSPAKGAVNVIVFDTLNATVTSKAYARAQLLKFLRRLPPGQQVALFTLRSRLQMVQDFTTSSDALIAAAENIPTGANVGSSVEPVPELGLHAQMEAKGAFGIALPPGGAPRHAPAVLAATALAETLREFENDSKHPEIMDVRVANTLDALRDLARATASLPGRKNVIWLTNGFPLKLKEPITRIDEKGLIRERDYSDNIRQVTALLASTQVAIYPVDLKGLEADWNSEALEKEFARDPQYNTRDSLQTVAEETGGRAFYDRNDIDAGIARVITTDSNYYTLAYSPRNIKWDGSYHKVGVKLARKGFQLTYRRGYHAIGESPLTEEQASRSLGDALGLDAMDSRMIVFAASFVQPEAQGQPVTIKYSIDPDTLVLDDSADGNKSAAVAIAAAAWDSERQKVGEVAKKVEMALKPDQYAKTKTLGIPWTMSMALNPGTYNLKLAVIDLKSGKTGSMSVPLKVEVKPRQPAATSANSGTVSPVAEVSKPQPTASATVPRPSVPQQPPAPSPQPFRTIDPTPAEIAEYCQALAAQTARPQALKSVCEFSLTVQQKLPNYICEEKLKRTAPMTNLARPMLPENIEAQVAFEDGRESYSNIRINGKPSATMDSELPSISSAGEFGTQLYSLFSPENKAKFKFKKELVLNSRPALLFEFDIDEDDNHSFKIWDIDGSKTHPGYSGSMWLDKGTLRPMRLLMTSKRTRFRAPFQDVKFETYYSDVPLADDSTFLLPVKSSVNACNPSLCFLNELEFTNCHKFGAKTQILPAE